METRHLPEFTQVTGAGTGAWNQIVVLHSAMRHARPHCLLPETFRPLLPC